jgi:hypothetical protein
MLQLLFSSSSKEFIVLILYFFEMLGNVRGKLVGDLGQFQLLVVRYFSCIHTAYQSLNYMI